MSATCSADGPRDPDPGRPVVEFDDREQARVVLEQERGPRAVERVRGDDVAAKPSRSRLSVAWLGIRRRAVWQRFRSSDQHLKQLLDDRARPRTAGRERRHRRGRSCTPPVGRSDRRGRAARSPRSRHWKRRAAASSRGPRRQRSTWFLFCTSHYVAPDAGAVTRQVDRRRATTHPCGRRSSSEGTAKHCLTRSSPVASPTIRSCARRLAAPGVGSWRSSTIASGRW